MHKISDFIVNHCYVIFGVFLIFVIICGILSTKVNINKDIYSYMPADSETTLGLNIMNDEFDYDSTSAYEMMLTNVPDAEKMQIKEHIESIEGVKSVDYDASDTYNRDNYTRYKINVDAPADSETANHVYNAIHNEYKDKFEIEEAGQVYNFNGEVMQIHVTVLAVGCAMVILLFMSKSWIEPWLFLFAILLAVVANKGTNIIFPNVSHITDAISAILQMALSMDYAIMLSTRYRQEKAGPDHPDKKTAMRRAMRYSFGAISSSSVTTVVGLIILVFMSFTIGRDMGLVLSKGVILSLVSIFTSLPALLLLFDKAVEKTEKKTLNFKMNRFGEYSFKLRKIAVPLFLLIFIGSFILKGNTNVTFTAEQNNHIKDIFSETNQIALVYDAKMDEEVTKVCQDFDKREDTARVLCYGNTINEPKRYNELVAKINDLSDEKVDTEDYIIKAIYYHYYKNIDAHEISLDDLVNFLQNEVFPNQNFAKDISNEMVSKVDRFSNFTNQDKVNRLRTKQEIADILGVKNEKLDDVYVLYLSEQNIPTKLTLYEFAQFVANDILTNPSYANMVTSAQRADLAKLQVFSNKAITDTPKTVTDLSNIFGIDQQALEQLVTYYSYTATDTPTISASAEELINFALSNKNVISEMNLSANEIAQLKEQFETAKSKIAELSEAPAMFDQIIAEFPIETQETLAPQITTIRTNLVTKINDVQNILTQKYTYSDIAEASIKVDDSLNNIATWLDNLESNYPELFESLDDKGKKSILEIAQKINNEIDSARQKIDLNDKLAKLKNVYKLYQAETSSSTTKISPRELVDFLLKHQNDDKLKSALQSNTIQQLGLVQYIMNNQNTKFSTENLAQTFNLDQNKIKLVYALYNYRYENTSPLLSLKTLINFIDEKVLTNPDYANRLSEEEQTKLRTIAILTRAAANGNTYNYEALYRAILPLANNLDKNQLFLAYLYHGSLYDYDDNWTLTVEEFINFVSDKVLPDSRFVSHIDSDMCEKISDGRKTIDEAKELLVGPQHYRALIESNLPIEDKQTFALISDLKTALGPRNKIDYFMVGDSAMAYEISQTFSNEMDFITVLTMLAIFAVVVCTFKSLFVSMLLVLVIQCAVYIVMAYLSLTGSSIFFIALIIVQSILMGATIDYAILFTSYYVENRNYYKMSIRDALISTYNRSINAILTSASILIIVTAIVGNMASAIAAAVCQAISLGTFCATLIILILLPALLATLDKFIIKSPREKTATTEKGLKKLLSDLKSIL